MMDDPSNTSNKASHKTKFRAAESFELANFIHHILAIEGQSLKPFRGKQQIIVGKFLQLSIVPNKVVKVDTCRVISLDEATTAPLQTYA